MVKDNRKMKRDYDFSAHASMVVQEATGQVEQKRTQRGPEFVDGKNPHAVALGRLGGLKGGKARALKLTSAERSEIARKAAEKLWKK